MNVKESFVERLKFKENLDGIDIEGVENSLFHPFSPLLPPAFKISTHDF